MTIRAQVIFPRSKKKRIRKKWAKRMENWAIVPNPEVILDHRQGVIIGHPATIARLKQAIQPTGAEG